MTHIGKHVDLKMDGNILIATYKAGPKIDLPAAKLIVKERMRFTNQQCVPVLVIDHGLVSMDRQARDYMSSDEAVKGIRASAIISSSTVNKVLVNFIMRISRPNLPVKMFTNHDLAVKWLNGLADEHQ